MNPYILGSFKESGFLLNLWPELQYYAHLDAAPEQTVIRWGESTVQVPEDWQEINGRRSLQRLADPKAVKDILDLNHIPSGLSVQNAAGIYRLLVCDAKVYMTTRRGNGAVGAPLKRAVVARRLAVRATYCLGLDFALVDVGVFPRKDGRPLLAVCSVEPAPKLGPKGKENLVTALRELVQLIEKEKAYRQGLDPYPPMVTLGTDPEFVLRERSTQRLLMANRFFPRYGRAGYDARPILYQEQRGYPLVEIRCAPASEPLMLIRELAGSLRVAHRRLPRYGVEWLAGGQPFPKISCGGHMHIHGAPLNFRLIRALDHYLGVPLMLCEHPLSASLRRKQYGLLGEFRVKSHGGFEYRCPASWLVSPRYAYATASLTWLIARNYPKLRADWLWYREAQQAFYQADGRYFRPHLARLHQDLACLTDYDQVGDIIQWFFEQLMEGKRWPEDRNFRRRWFPVRKGRSARS